MLKFFGAYGEYGWLSNFYKCKIIYDKKEFCCSEQIFMYVKANFFNDSEMIKEIYENKDKHPNFYKSLGRKIKNYDEQKWNSVRYEVMLDCLRAKFNSNVHLKKKLLATKQLKLVEASPYDIIWGIGLSADDPKSNNESEWKGRNLLGQVLMEIRTQLED